MKTYVPVKYHLNNFFFSGAEGNFTWVEMIQRDKSKRKRQRKYRLKVAMFLLQENKTFLAFFLALVT